MGKRLMLILKAACETCSKPLPAESAEAHICSFECTFCAKCAEKTHHGKCPNCGGVLEKRPTRTGAALQKYPAGTTG